MGHFKPATGTSIQDPWFSSETSQVKDRLSSSRRPAAWDLIVHYRLRSNFPEEDPHLRLDALILYYIPLDTVTRGAGSRRCCNTTPRHFSILHRPRQRVSYRSHWFFLFLSRDMNPRRIRPANIVAAVSACVGAEHSNL